jgi:hypothetical protein
LYCLVDYQINVGRFLIQSERTAVNIVTIVLRELRVKSENYLTYIIDFEISELRCKLYHEGRTTNFVKHSMS